MIDRKSLIWVVTFIITAIALPHLIRQGAPDITLPSLEIRSDALLTGLVYKRFKDNIAVLELIADQATLIKKEGVLDTKNPRLFLYRLNLKTASGGRKRNPSTKPVRVKARRGRLDIDSMETIFFDDVVLKTPDQGTLYTDVLAYSPKTHTLKSDVPVIIKRGGLEIQGSSLLYDTLTGRLLIKGSTTNINGS